MAAKVPGMKALKTKEVDAMGLRRPLRQIGDLIEIVYSGKRLPLIDFYAA
jgi:hypothetical protein